MSHWCSLFASILRREEDGDYYLVTPAEKWRIEVELHPLIVIDVESVEERQQSCWRLRLTPAESDRQMSSVRCFWSPRLVTSRYWAWTHGLSALFSRAAWYRLVELAEEREGGACDQQCGTGLHAGAASLSESPAAAFTPGRPTYMFG